jgi:[calcium/calmodulin-dependent protein kinase] kinase
MPFIAEGVVLPSRSTYLPLLGEAVDEYSTKQTITVGDDRIARAKEEQIRRLIQEGENQNHKRPVSASGPRPQSSLSQGACPPSPDDIMFARHEETSVHYQNFSPLGPPTAGYTVAGPRKSIVNSSSEDHFTSGMSQSTSNPSIPSVISAHSSVTTDNDGFQVTDLPKDHAILASDDTVAVTEQQPTAHDDYDGYAGDHALDSGDDSDGSYIEMSMKKPAARTAAQRTISNSFIGQSEAPRRPRRSTEASATSGRTGSNNTMQKVLLSQSDGEDDSTRSRKVDSP